MIKVNEIFGPTIQGEGAAAGRHCLFVRTALCNLECSWCDTDYTWAFTEVKAAKHRNNTVHDKSLNLTEMTPAAVLDRLEQLWPIYEKPTIIVISGGEPMMQQQQLMPLLCELRALDCEVHIETAGTIAPAGRDVFESATGVRMFTEFDEMVTQYNVSPKLDNSGNVVTKRTKPEVLEHFAGNIKAWFKFVVTHTDDFEEIDFIVDQYGIVPRRVMVMPEGVTIDQNISVARDIADCATARGYGLSFRSHILLWPKENRGR